MRAGLLSKPEVIQYINKRFVSTTITYFDLQDVVKKGDPLAIELAANWANPVTLMFLTSEGRYISKLDVLRDLNAIHPDTTFRPGQKRDPCPEENMQVFLNHVNQYFGLAP